MTTEKIKNTKPVIEIGNFTCVRCGESIRHDDLVEAVVTLSRNKKV
jgi:hypothetical protein